MPLYHKRSRLGLSSIKSVLAFTLGFMLIHTPVAFADYVIAPGDVLEISVVSVPELRQRATVSMDGQISYPLIGIINVAGLSLNELQNKLKNELTNKSVRSRVSDGSERAVYIYPEEISVIIAEHRPVYVNGDVSKPGELGYRPRMTVRQAIALAGGLDVMRFRAGDPALHEVDLQTEGRLLRTEYLRQQAIVSRLSGELNRKPETGQHKEATLLNQDVLKMQKAQTEQLELALDDHKKEIGSLERSIEQTQSQISTLGRLREELLQSYQQQANEVARLKANFEKGLAPIARISEEQRALTFVSERLLQTEAELTVARRGQEEQKRQLQKAEDQRRLRLTRELDEAENKLVEIRTRIQATGDKLLYVGSLRSRLLENSGGKPIIKVVRKTGSKWDGYGAEFETELMPGDVVEVMLPNESLKAIQ